MTLLETLLAAMGGAAAALTVAGFLAKKLIELQVSRVLEAYKAELEQRSHALKTELSIYAHEQNVGISRLDQQRSEAIQKIYRVVIEVQELFLAITQPRAPGNLSAEQQLERYLHLARAFVKVAEKLSVVTLDNAIFFQQESHDAIANFGRAAIDLSCEFYDLTFGRFDLNQGLSAHPDLPGLIEAQRARLRDAMDRELGRSRELLLTEFRRLMGAASNRRSIEPQA